VANFDGMADGSTGGGFEADAAFHPGVVFAGKVGGGLGVSGGG
jgi:hypothetical protein